MPPPFACRMMTTKVGQHSRSLISCDRGRSAPLGSLDSRLPPRKLGSRPNASVARPMRALTQATVKNTTRQPSMPHSCTPPAVHVVKFANALYNGYKLHCTASANSTHTVVACLDSWRTGCLAFLRLHQ